MINATNIRCGPHPKLERSKLNGDSDDDLIFGQKNVFFCTEMKFKILK